MIEIPPPNVVSWLWYDEASDCASALFYISTIIASMWVAACGLIHSIDMRRFKSIMKAVELIMTTPPPPRASKAAADSSGIHCCV